MLDLFIGRARTTLGAPFGVEALDTPAEAAAHRLQFGQRPVVAADQIVAIGLVSLRSGSPIEGSFAQLIATVLKPLGVAAQIVLFANQAALAGHQRIVLTPECRLLRIQRRALAIARLDIRAVVEGAAAS